MPGKGAVVHSGERPDGIGEVGGSNARWLHFCAMSVLSMCYLRDNLLPDIVMKSCSPTLASERCVFLLSLL